MKKVSLSPRESPINSPELTKENTENGPGTATRKPPERSSGGLSFRFGPPKAMLERNMNSPNNPNSGSKEFGALKSPVTPDHAAAVVGEVPARFTDQENRPYSPSSAFASPRPFRRIVHASRADLGLKDELWRTPSTLGRAKPAEGKEKAASQKPGTPTANEDTGVSTTANTAADVATDIETPGADHVDSPTVATSLLRILRAVIVWSFVCSAAVGVGVAANPRLLDAASHPALREAASLLRTDVLRALQPRASRAAEEQASYELSQEDGGLFELSAPGCDLLGDSPAPEEDADVELTWNQGAEEDADVEQEREPEPEPQAHPEVDAAEYPEGQGSELAEKQEMEADMEEHEASTPDDAVSAEPLHVDQSTVVDVELPQLTNDAIDVTEETAAESGEMMSAEQPGPSTSDSAQDVWAEALEGAAQAVEQLVDVAAPVWAMMCFPLVVGVGAACFVAWVVITNVHDRWLWKSAQQTATNGDGELTGAAGPLSPEQELGSYQVETVSYSKRSQVSRGVRHTPARTAAVTRAQAVTEPSPDTIPTPMSVRRSRRLSTIGNQGKGSPAEPVPRRLIESM